MNFIAVKLCNLSRQTYITYEYTYYVYEPMYELEAGGVGFTHVAAASGGVACEWISLPAFSEQFVASAPQLTDGNADRQSERESEKFFNFFNCILGQELGHAASGRNGCVCSAPTTS